MINPKTMNTNLSLRRRLGLEIARKITNTLVEQHPLKQLFWNVLYAVTCIAVTVAAIARKYPVMPICLKKIFFGFWII